MLTMSNAKTDSTNGTMPHFVMPYSNNSISNGETNGHESQQQQIQNTLKQQNEINEKKRKLTLPIPLMSNSTSSDSGSISSDSSSNNLANLINMGELNNAKLNGSSNASTLDSLIPQAKKLKSIYTPEGLINFTTLSETPSLTKDLVHHLDINNNISTPQIDKLLADFNASNYNLKTPGSALALLTPVNSLAHVFSQQSAADQQSILNLSNYATTTPDDPNYIALHNNLFNRTISEIAAAALTPSSAINPNNIFGNLQQQQQQHQQQQQQQQNQMNSNPKYTTLTNIQSSSATASSSSDATKTANDTGNYYLNVQQQSSNETNTSTGGSSSSSSTVKYDLNNNNTNANANLNIKIKDELQTVPVHPLSNNDKLNKTSTKKGKYNNSTAIKSETNAGSKKTSQQASEMENMNGTLNIVELKPKDGMNSMNAMGLTARRDTDNSTTSSNNLESNNFSPINLSDQEALKLEKKRERNREAARKCRTRKLEKIEQLQQQVQTLTDSNKQERAKNMALSEELNKIRQKLENHQKLHNCDLNMNL